MWTESPCRPRFRLLLKQKDASPDVQVAFLLAEVSMSVVYARSPVYVHTVKSLEYMTSSFQSSAIDDFKRKFLVPPWLCDLNYCA